MAIYIKFGDEIKGEASDDKHEDFCDILSADFSVDQPVSAMGTGGRSSGRSSPSPCSIQMVSDKAYPEIYHHCAMGKHIVGDVVLHQVQNSGEDKIVYDEVIFTECMISSCNLSVSGEDKPYVNLAFVYDSIELIHTPAKDAGDAAAKATKAFNFKDNA